MFFIKRIMNVPSGRYEEHYMSKHIDTSGVAFLQRNWDDFINVDTEVYHTMKDAEDAIRMLWVNYSQQWIGSLGGYLQYIDLNIDDNNTVDIPVVLGGNLLSSSIIHSMFIMNVAAKQTQTNDIDDSQDYVPGDALKQYKRGKPIDWISIAKKKYGA